MGVASRRERFTKTASNLIRKHRPDYTIISYIAVLIAIGLIIIFAIGPQRANTLNQSYGGDIEGTYFVVKQFISVLLALGSFIVFAKFVPYDFLAKHMMKLLGVAFAACALLFLFGNVLGVDSVAKCTLGACRWFEVPGLGTFQPSELLKFSLLVFLSAFVGVRAQKGLINSKDKTLIPILILAAICAVFVIVFQKDLGTGVALVAIIAAMLTAGGIDKRVGLWLIAGAFVAGLVLIVSAPHRVDRVLTFLKGDETSVEDDSAYHIAHAKIALGTGGLFGVGVGNSVQAAGYLPEVINDSVFAVLGETFGLIGLLFILLMFYLLLLRLLKVMDHLEDKRYKLLVAGVFGWIGAHVIINVGAMIGLLPLTGITLPFLSFGGTSMIFISAALGLVFQVSQYTVHSSAIKEDISDANSNGRRGVGRTRHASRRSTSRT